MVLEANPDYWNRERGPRVERVVFRNDVDPERALELVCEEEGEVDILTEVDPGDAERVVASEHAHLEVVDAMRVLTGIINRGAEDVPLDDVRARRALNLAVDREGLVEEGLGGYAHPTPALTPPHAEGFPRELAPYPWDPERARELLKEAGWPSGRALRLAAPSELEGVARRLEEDFGSSLGVGVETEIVPPEELLAAQHVLVEKEVTPPFDVLVHAWFDLASDAPPAVVHREFYHSTGAFRAGPPLPEFEELFGRFAAEIDEIDRFAAEIDRFAHEQALSVFLCAPQALYAVNDHVDFTGHAATFELAETEVDAGHWSRR